MSRVDELMAELFGVPPYFKCAECGRLTPTSKVELSADCRPICPRCYLSNVPEEDIAAALHDAEVSFEGED